MKKALLAYSGGLDTSAILVWLQKELGMEVYCYCCDLGNQPDEKWLREKAFALGAKDFVFEDMKEEFCNEYAMRIIRNGALYESEYLLGTAIGRPLIAKRMGLMAEKYTIDTFVHGATGKGNDQLRLEQSWAYLYPDKEILTPWKTWSFKGRQDLILYLKEQGFPYVGESSGRYSIDENLFHKSTEGGELEDVSLSYDFDVIVGQKISAEPIVVKLSFESAKPISLNGESMPTHKLFEALNEIGRQRGIGIIDLVEERVNGIKSRGIYQTPGGTILFFAIKKLKEICWGHKLTKISQIMANEYAELVYDGSWFSKARESIDAYFDYASKNLTGEISLEIHNSFMKVLSRTSDHTLYSQQLVSFEEDRFDINKSAVGFCQTRNLSFKNEGRVK